MDNGDIDYRWQYAQSAFLVFLFALWLIIGVFVAREVILVLIDHRRNILKPLPRQSYQGVYSVKKNRYIKERSYQPSSNGITDAP